MALISPSRRLRRTPFSDGVEAAGGKGYTVYNHMLLPAVFRSVEEDYRHLKDAVQVWDVACSSGRRPDVSGKCPVTTADVNLETCETVGNEGASELQVTFTDPDFSPDQPAFYYARVLENPTCRWTTRLTNSADRDLPDDLSATLQERGWSSPIWSRSPGE